MRTEGFDHNASAKGCHRLPAGCRGAVALSAQGALAGRDGASRARPDRSPQRRRQRLVLRGCRGRAASARESEARWMAGAPPGLLDGIPVGIKDNLLVAGMPARFGSRLTSDAPSAEDAPAVARLREQGAIVIGKTTMPEFGWKAVTDSPLTGVTRNPWDTRKTPGGSSGGAVAAVVLGMGNVHLGTDGGGSIRIPAAFGGSYGIKPTRARVPAWPAAPLGTLAHVGCLTRSVADAALALDRHGRARTCAMSTPGPRPRPTSAPASTTASPACKVAYSPRLGYAARVEPEIATAVDGCGGRVRGARRPRRRSRSRSRRRPDRGLDHVVVVIGRGAVAGLWRARARARRPGPRCGRSAGARTSAIDYIRAQLERAELHGACARFFERYDLLLTPTMPLAAFEAGHLMPPSGDWGEAWTDWCPFSYPFNLTQSAGGVHSLRTDARRAPDRPPDRRRNRCGRACPARKPRLRGCQAVRALSDPCTH